MVGVPWIDPLVILKCFVLITVGVCVLEIIYVGLLK